MDNLSCIDVRTEKLQDISTLQAHSTKGQIHNNFISQKLIFNINPSVKKTWTNKKFPGSAASSAAKLKHFSQVKIEKSGTVFRTTSQQMCFRIDRIQGSSPPPFQTAIFPCYSFSFSFFLSAFFPSFVSAFLNPYWRHLLPTPLWSSLCFCQLLLLPENKNAWDVSFLSGHC